MNQKSMGDKGVLSNLIWKFAERFSAQTVSTLVSIILARILLPDDYGLISLILVFINIADVFVIHGLGAALIQKNNPDEMDYSSVLWMNLGISVVLYVLLFFAAVPISSFYGYDNMVPIIRVFSLRLIVAGFNSIQHAYVSKNMLFKRYFWSALFGTVLSGVLGIWLAYQGAGAWALVAQYLTNSCVGTVVLFFTVRWRPKLIFSAERIRPLFGYGWKITFEAVSNALATQLRNLVIGKVYSAGDLAYYTKGQSFPSLLINNIGLSISSVLFPAMSNANENVDHVRDMMRKSVRYSSFVLFPLLAGFAMIARPFIEIVLTAKWLPAVAYLQVFCIIMILQVGMYPRHEALKAIGRSDVYMNEHIVFRVIDIVLLFMFLKKGVIYILLSQLASAALLSLILAYTSCRYNHYPIKDQVMDILKPAISSMIMCGVLFFVGRLTISSLTLMLIQIGIGGIVYFVCCLALRDQVLLDMVQMVQSLKGNYKKERDRRKDK